MQDAPNKYLLSIYYMQDTSLVAEDVAVSKPHQNLCPYRTYVCDLKLL